MASSLNSGGISLSTTNSTTYHLNPSGDATKKLYSWYSIEKPTSDIKALSVTSSRDASSQGISPYYLKIQK